MITKKKKKIGCKKIFCLQNHLLVHILWTLTSEIDVHSRILHVWKMTLISQFKQLIKGEIIKAEFFFHYGTWLKAEHFRYGT